MTIRVLENVLAIAVCLPCGCCCSQLWDSYGVCRDRNFRQRIKTTRPAIRIPLTPNSEVDRSQGSQSGARDRFEVRPCTDPAQVDPTSNRQTFPNEGRTDGGPSRSSRRTETREALPLTEDVGSVTQTPFRPARSLVGTRDEIEIHETRGVPRPDGAQQRRSKGIQQVESRSDSSQVGLDSRWNPSGSRVGTTGSGTLFEEFQQ